MKTIESLVNASKKVYVHMSSDEICRRFFAQAEREGFLFGGENPTDKHPSDLIAVLPDKRLCYVGTIGRIAARSGVTAQQPPHHPKRKPSANTEGLIIHDS